MAEAVSFGGVTTTEVALNSVPLPWGHGRKLMVNVALSPAARVTFVGVAPLRVSDQLPPGGLQIDPGEALDAARGGHRPEVWQRPAPVLSLLPVLVPVPLPVLLPASLVAPAFSAAAPWAVVAEDEDVGADDWSPAGSLPLPFPQAVSARASADVAASAVAQWSVLITTVWVSAQQTCDEGVLAPHQECQ